MPLATYSVKAPKGFAKSIIAFLLWRVKYSAQNDKKRPYKQIQQNSNIIFVQLYFEMGLTFDSQ